MQKLFGLLALSLSLLSCSDSSMVTIRIDAGFKSNPVKNLLSGLVTASSATTPSTCIQNNIIAAYGLANVNSDSISSQSVSFVTPLTSVNQTIDSLWLAQNAGVGDISISIPRNVNYNVGIVGSIVTPVAANSDGTCVTEVPGFPNTELPTTTLFGYSTINKSDNADLSLKVWVIPSKSDLPPPTAGSVCANQGASHDQNPQLCPNNNFYRVYCDSCLSNHYSLRFSYFASNNGRPPVIQNFDSGIFVAGGYGAFIPNKKPFTVSVLSNGRVVGSAEYNSSSPPGPSFSIPIAGVGTLPIVLLEPSKPNAFSLKLSGGSAVLMGACAKFKVSLVDSKGQIFNAPSGMSISLGASIVGIGFYSDNNCGISLNSGATSIASGLSSADFYIQQQAGASFTITASTAATLGTINSDSLNITTKMATRISAGFHHTCAIISGGIQCWGLNSSGQLGNGTQIDSPLPVQVTGFPSGVNATEVSAGYNFTCAVVNGAAYCWGSNSVGQLGNGSVSSTVVTTPVQVSGLGAGMNVTQISASGGIDGTAGGTSACAIVNGGFINCWGLNSSGQLGDGTTTSHASPVPVASPFDVAGSALSISVGASTSCGIKTTANNLYCWGAGTNGELGLSPTPTPPATVPASSATYGIFVSSFNSHSCLISNVGNAVSCWGLNTKGQVGNGSISNAPTPAPIGITAATGGFGPVLSVGGLHTCAIVSGGVIYCWGDNSMNQLGISGSSNLPSPTLVPNIPNTANSIASGSFHNCAILSNGPIVCWGSNSNGELGNGATSFSNPNPMPVFGFQ